MHTTNLPRDFNCVTVNTVSKLLCLRCTVVTASIALN